MSELQTFIAAKTPAGWETRPLWSLFRRQKLTGFADEELLSVYRDYGVIPKSSRDDNHNKESDDLSGYQLVTEGSLVTNKMKAWQGSIAISRYRGIVSPAYYVYEPLSEECDQFLHYLLRSEPYIALYGRISKGVRVNQWDLEHEALRNVPVMLPDLDTQKAIADFLDRETARIDQLIEKKQRLVGILIEREKNLIGECLTRGVNPEVELKTVQQEWLGSIPSHWEVFPLKSLIWYQEGPGILADDFREEGIPLLRIKGLSGQYATLKGCNYLDPAKVKKRWNHFRVEVGDFLISASATRGGIASLVTQDVMGAVPYTGIIRIKPRDKGYVSEIIPYFLLSSLFDTQIDLLSAGSTIQHFGPTHLGRMKAPLPPQAEQREIAKFLDKRVPLIRQARAQTIGSQDKLKEFRSALITAAVTGQIDVTMWAKRGQADRQLDEIQEAMRA